jgi:hypothetical protein
MPKLLPVIYRPSKSRFKRKGPREHGDVRDLIGARILTRGVELIAVYDPDVFGVKEAAADWLEFWDGAEGDEEMSSDYILWDPMHCFVQAIVKLSWSSDGKPTSRIVILGD